ncbi:FAD-dependent oxidoreductase [Actinopolymorpha singaporensis]
MSSAGGAIDRLDGGDASPAGVSAVPPSKTPVSRSVPSPRTAGPDPASYRDAAMGAFRRSGRIVIVIVIVIVGASLAGLAAATTLRRERFTGPLTMIGDEPYQPYDRPPLPKQSARHAVIPPSAHPLPRRAGSSRCPPAGCGHGDLHPRPRRPRWLEHLPDG